MNNLQRVQNIFISNGSATPAGGSPITSVTPGVIGVYGTNMNALAASATVSSSANSNAIYLVEGKTDASGTNYVKRSPKIDGMSIISYQGESYAPAQRNVWSIGYSRAAAAGLIEVNNDVNYNFTIRFKNDKWLYSERPELLNINFQSSSTATQLSIATQIASAINNSAYKKQVVAIVVGDGTGVYGVTGASNYGVEITAKDVDQFFNSTYTPNKVYFSVQVNDATGFGTSTTCTEIQAFDPGVGTYDQVYMLENKCFGYEGVANRRQWPIPVLDYSASSSYVLSAAITPTVTGTIAEDKVTFSATVAAILRAGEKVELGGVNYEIKYFISSTVAILTSPLVAGLAAAAAKVRFQYDMVTIEYNDAINTPTGVVAVANKSAVIAMPAIDAGGAYNSTSTIATSIITGILNYWMPSTAKGVATISI
jgi:hypothetical protein